MTRGTSSAAAPSIAEALANVCDLLGAIDGHGAAPDQIELVSQLRAVQAASGAALARVSVQFDLDRVAEARDDHVSLERQRGSVVGQLALAQRRSPSATSTRLGQFRRLVHDLPETHGLFAVGEINEQVALSVSRAARGLTPEQLADLDRELAPDLPGLTWKQAEARVRAYCARVDPDTQLRRMRMAEGEANVSCRPVADGMARVSILAPTVQAVGMYASLRTHAESSREAGESMGQAMVAAAFTRLTGRESAADLPIEIQLVMTDRALLDDAAAEPARVQSTTGPSADDAWLPALLARRLALGLEAMGDGSADVDVTSARWIRRLYTDPVTGTLTGIDTKRRDFTSAQRRFIVARDQVCTTPWCDAPVRHIDHAVPHSRGGPTDLINGNGKCARCNQHKDHDGWATAATPAHPGTPHGITVTTPTGHTYSSASPPVLRRPRGPKLRRIRDALLRGNPSAGAPLGAVDFVRVRDGESTFTIDFAA